MAPDRGSDVTSHDGTADVLNDLAARGDPRGPIAWSFRPAERRTLGARSRGAGASGLFQRFDQEDDFGGHPVAQILGVGQASVAASGSMSARMAQDVHGSDAWPNCSLHAIARRISCCASSRRRSVLRVLARLFLARPSPATSPISTYLSAACR